MSKQNIEDIYPLSPMQQGMLFHRLYATRTDVYFHQAEFTLHGKLDVAAFEKAWERVVSRHPILRSAFIWERGQEPFQVVRQRVKLPLEHQDWRELSRDEQEAELAAFLKADRERGIELFKAPLMRLTLVQLTDDVSHLVWSHHHMLLDGWSVVLVLKEIFTFYEALQRREDLHLERPRPYGDYIAWLQSQDLIKAEQFWRETLKGFRAPIKLGVEQASTDLHAHEHGYSDLSIGLTEQEAARLHGFAQQQKLTVNTLVQGAWAVLLARYSGEEDVVFGAATSGRPVELIGVESMIGNFINTLPVRVRVKPQDKTLDWLRQLQKQQVEARQFEYSPLVQIQKWSEIPPGESLFETIVIFENYPVDASLRESRGGLKIDNPRVDDRTNYPLSLVIGGGSRFSLRFIYDRGRYDTATIERMLGHLKTILIGMIEHSLERLSYLPLLTVEERREMLVDWNDTSTDYAKDRCIHELFETQVEATPGAIAVVSDDEELTYGELNERANQLAHLLKSTGVGPSSLIAVLMHRSSNMIPALLAILKAGGAYVPIEPAYPNSRIEWILSSHHIDCLITQSSLLQTVAELQLPELEHIVCLDQAGDDGAIVELGPQKKIWMRDDLHLFATENLPAQTSPEDFAYIIFTSGSTGTPKGVIVSHQPVINLIDWVNRTFDINSSDRILFITSLCFDLSVYDVFGLLAAGGSIRVVSDSDVRDPERLLHMLTTEPITFWDSAPAALQQLVPFFSATRFPHGNKLRLVFMSGDWVPVTLPELLMRTFPSVEVIALGGATEATVWSNFYPISEVDPSWPSIPYGKPIQNSQYHVADKFLNPCPIGVAGDLYIGGECLSTGYSYEPITTAEKFIPNPFSQAPGDRLYKTGDRARYFASGDIEFLGRVDNQVKIRGFRIELGEIEAALSQHPAIHAAIVVAREDVPKEKHLVAYLVPDEERAQTISNLLRLEENGELAEHQQQELPNGMLVVYRNKNETDFMFKKIFEDESYLHHQIKLEPGACVFDVGANIGLFSLFVGQVCSSARIYAFEPLPPLFDALRINTQLHGLDVKLLPCGLGSETKVEEFTYYPNVTLISGRFADAVEEREIVKSFLLNQPETHDPAEEPSGAQLDELLTERLQSERIACQLKTLSDVIRENGVEGIDLLKINVEKSELDVLAGIEDADWQKIRQIIVEVHDIDNRLQQISRMLEGQGYSLIVEQEEWLKDTGLYNIFAVRPDTRSTASRDDDVRSRARDQQKNVWTSPSRLISDARDFLKAKLPEYMMPSAFVLLHSLPLTSNGKVDRRALPTPGKDRKTLEGAFVPPRTSVEELLADIWAEVLGVERVGVNDNFFELGGDSILSIQVNARATKAGLKLTTRQLFQHRTIAELAAAASMPAPIAAEQEAVSDSVPPTPIGATQDVEEFYPLSPLQEGMLFHNLYAPEAGDYILQFNCLLERLPEVAGFEEAWQRVVDRHTVLRTFFVWEGVKRPIQVVQREVKLPLEQQDWRGLEKSEQEEALKSFLLKDRARGFDLNRAPLMRLMLIRLDQHSYYFIWTHHHLLLDGWSLPLIFREVFETYEALRQGEEREQTRPRPFRDYIAWLQQQDMEQAEVFWRQMMSGLKTVPRLQIARHGGKSGAGYKELRVALPAATTTALRALGREHQLTLNTLVQGAVSLLLSHYTRSQEVVFGMTVSGRPAELPDIETMVGVFINVLPMRVRIRLDEALLDWLQGIQEQQMEMRQYEYTPLTQIARWSDVPGGQSLFETVLSFENYPVNDTLPQIGDRLSIQQHRIESKDNYPLGIGVVPDQQLHLWLTYDSQLDTEAIRDFGELFQTLLNCFVTQPHTDVKTLQELLSREADKQQARRRREREENSLQRFKKVKPKPDSLSSDNLVALDTLTPEGVLPLVFRPQVDDLDLADWARSHRELIETNLSKHGALLFRGAKLKTADDFEQVAAAICPELFDEYGDLPRESLGGKVYSSTPFPPDQAILFHNESSHQHRWPMKIWFFCMKAPEQGGETPIVDGREVYKMLDPHLRDRFARKGLLYVRNYIEGLDVSWQSFFQTTDKAAVEAYCRQASIDFEWTSNNNLRTRCHAPAVVRHPKTGEFSFFNQIQLHHISFLPSDVRSSLTSVFREEDLPRNVYYGDGSALEESVLSEILQIYQAASVSFPWQPGDILTLDNVLIAHGRNPYSGERKIVVTMGEMVSGEEMRV